MIATITTPRIVAPTLTCPPVSTAPPMTGAAKDRISQSSPIVGWPICSRATEQDAGQRRDGAGERMGDDDGEPDRDAGKLGRVTVAAHGEDAASDRQPCQHQPQAEPTIAVGTMSQGSGPRKGALPRCFTDSGCRRTAAPR